VLFEDHDHDGYLHGFTENYIKIKTPYQSSLTNTFCEVNLDHLDRDGIYKSATESTIEI
jgi:threonylcarbamoyladenosine tRNA methylthiotransferase MtaB